MESLTTAQLDAMETKNRSSAGLTTDQLDQMEANSYTQEPPMGLSLGTVKDTFSYTKPLTPEEARIKAEADFQLSANTGIPVNEISEVGNLRPKRTVWEKAKLLANRFSDQLNNSTVAPLMQTITGDGESNWAQVRVHELIKDMEKKQGVVLSEQMYDDQFNDWLRQLYLPSEQRESEILKGEKQYIPPKEISGFFPIREVDKAEGWADSGVDVLAGLIGFVGEFEGLKRVMPSAPHSVLMETVSLANGGKPGSGSSMYGAMGFIGNIFPNTGIASKLAGGVGAGALLGGTTLLAGGDPKEAIINFGIPSILGYMSIGKAEWNTLKPKSKLDLITASKAVIPELKNETVSSVDKLISDTLQEKGKAVSTEISSAQVSKAISESTSISSQPVIPETSTEAMKELSPSRLAQRTEELAIEKKLTEEFSDLAGYDKMSMPEQAKLAKVEMDKDYEAAKKMALGEINPPANLRPASIHEAVKFRATMEGDVETLRQLALPSDTSIATRLSELGQEIKAADVRNPEDPVKAMQDIIKTAEKSFESRTKTKVKSAKKQGAKEIKDSIAKESKTRTIKTWEDFIVSLQC